MTADIGVMAGKKSTPTKKAACAASWARGEARKKTRREKQEAAAKVNAANPTSTPWATAKGTRAARRAGG